MAAVLYGGVEGGGTHSTLMLFSSAGSKLAEVEGPSTNLYQIGIPETNNRIAAMVVAGLEQAGLPANTQLQGDLKAGKIKTTTGSHWLLNGGLMCRTGAESERV